MIYKLKLIFLIFFLYGHVAHAISIEDFKNLEGQSSFKVQKVNKYIDYFSQNRKGRDFFRLPTLDLVSIKISFMKYLMNIIFQKRLFLYRC